MAVTRGATTSQLKITAVQNNGDFTHTVDASTSLLLLIIAIEGGETISSGPVWDSAGVNEALTVVHSSVGAIDNSDVIVHFYAVVVPTAKTATISVGFTSNVNPAWLAAVNYLGTETASVAAATNFLTEDVNTNSTNTGVHASGGSAGNALVMGGAGQGFDMTPAAQTAGTTFTEIFDTDTGGASTTEDFGVWLGDLLNSAPSAITLTWGATDENSSVLIELVAAGAGGGTVPVSANHYLYNLKT